MADLDDVNDTKNFHVGVPERREPFFLKGSGALDWGMQNRLARIFDPTSGRTVMLAIDHGYFQGPTSGLERVDVNIVPLLPYADALMLTRGILRTTIPPSFGRGVVLRASGGPSILKELSNEQLAVDIEDAVRLNVAAMAVQVFVGGEFETQSIHNLTRLVDVGNRDGIPTLGVTAVGKNMTRDARYFRLACRICAELGAHFVKTYYVRRGLRDGDRVVPGADRHGRRQEAPRARRAHHGLPRGVGRGGGRRHGAQHLPVRRARRHDPGGRRGRARAHEARAGLRPLPDPPPREAGRPRCRLGGGSGTRGGGPGRPTARHLHHVARGRALHDPRPAG